MSNKIATTGFWASFPVHFKRALSVDLDPGTILPDEREALEVHKIHGASEAMRRLLLWRRSMLYIALLLFTPTALLGLIDNVVEMADTAQSTGALAGLKFLVVLLNLTLCVGLFAAYRRWRSWSRSRRVLFWCWLLAFLAPFLVALFPVRSLVDAPTIGIQFGREAAQMALVLSGVIGALDLVVQLAPKAVSLIPGLIRAALATKVLFPRSTAPGWLLMLSAPFYILLVYIVMMMPYQVGGSVLILLSLLCFIAAPVVLWRSGGRLSQPLSPDEATAAIKRLRMTTLALNAGGGLFLLIGLIDLMGELQLGAITIIQLLIALPANVLVLNVVGVDATKVALVRAYRRRTAPGYAEGVRAHDEAMAVFASAQPEEPHARPLDGEAPPQ